MNREHNCIINKWLRWWCLGNISYLDECFSRCASQTSSISITWELIKNANSGTASSPPQTYWVRNWRWEEQSVFYQVFPEILTHDKLENHWFQGRSNLAHSLFLVSQILLKHSHFDSFTYCVCCFCTITAVLNSCKRELIANKTYNNLLSGPLQKKPCDPLV